MKVVLAYGQKGLAVELPEDRTTVIRPAHVPGLPDEHRAVLDALERPIAARPLRELAAQARRICITFSDLTRATPNDRLIPWLLDHLRDVPPERITLVNQTGTHRPSTAAELEKMLTAKVTARYRVLNHEAENAAELVPVGTLRDGTPALINRHVVAADLRIVTGFIEPHFFAGFSGGVKGIIPGCGGLRTVMSNHGSRNLSHPQATFGFNEGNPLWEELREVALRVGPSFLLNVTLNEQRQITGVFAGDLIGAHRVGTEFVRKSAMQSVEAAFDVVLTTNSGAPLDLNLYQGVKGLSAGARILKPGGTMILACECREGVPMGSPCDRLLRSGKSADDLLAKLAQPGFSEPEQWQVQILAQILKQGRVLLYSTLPDEVTRACHLLPCHDISATVHEALQAHGPDARLAVLPQGPLTIPYVGAAGVPAAPFGSKQGQRR